MASVSKENAQKEMGNLSPKRTLHLRFDYGAKENQIQVRLSNLSNDVIKFELISKNAFGYEQVTPKIVQPRSLFTQEVCTEDVLKEFNACFRMEHFVYIGKTRYLAERGKEYDLLV